MIQKHTLFINTANTYRATKTGTSYTQETSTFSVTCGEISGFTDVSAYEWSTLANAAVTKFNTNNPVVTRVDLEFYSYTADASPAGELGIFKLTSAPSSAGTPTDLFNLINDAPTRYTTYSPSSDQKVLNRVTLGQASTNQVCIDVTNAIKQNSSFFAVGIRKTSSADGRVQLSGQTMSDGVDTLWHAFTGLEIQSPPVLIIYITQDADTHIQHSMHYVSASVDEVLDSANSLGGHISSNEIYDSDYVSSAVNPRQTFIPVVGSTPSITTGLAQFGPEVFKYTGTDSTNKIIAGVTRGYAGSSYSSIIDPQAERLIYLDVTKLFNNQPAVGLDQYRCVAIKHFSSSTTRVAGNVSVYLTQDTSADVQIDAAIEIPKHDAHSGTVQSSISVSKIFTSVSSDVVGVESGLFNGSNIIIDPDGDNISTIIESFTISDGVATFVLQDAITATATTGFRVNPSPSQILDNEYTSPQSNNGRFLGFFGSGGSHSIGDAREHGGELRNYDAIYVWIRRSLRANVKQSNDAAAVIFLVFEDSGS